MDNTVLKGVVGPVTERYIRNSESSMIAGRDDRPLLDSARLDASRWTFDYRNRFQSWLTCARIPQELLDE